MDRSSRNTSDKNKGYKEQGSTEKLDRSARSKHVLVRQPDGDRALGTRQSEIAKPNANHEHFIPKIQHDINQTEYDQYKQNINEKLNSLEKKCNELKREDQQLEKRFKNLSWIKAILGIDSKNKIDKCEYQLKKKKEQIGNAIHYLENTIQGNPKLYAVASLKDMIRLRHQDEKELQKCIDSIKLRKPQQGDKLTPRQKRFKEQETARLQVWENTKNKNIEKHKNNTNDMIDKTKEKITRMLRESKEYMGRAERSKDLIRIFKAANQVNERVSSYTRMIKSIQRHKARNFPDLLNQCKIVEKQLEEYHKQLDETMKKRFGKIWTLRNVKSK